MREEHDRFVEFGAWVETLMGARRGEAPYELLAEWRRVFCVPRAAPYRCVRVVDVETTNGTRAFRLEDVRTNEVLVWARTEYDTGAPAVTMYHPELMRVQYAGWRSRTRWAARALPDNAFMMLTSQAWVHFAQCMFRHNERAFMVELASMPLFRRWRALWYNCRLRELWRSLLRKIWGDTCGDAVLSPLGALRRDCLSMYDVSLRDNSKKLQRELACVLAWKIFGDTVVMEDIGYRSVNGVVELAYENDGVFVCVRSSGVTVCDGFKTLFKMDNHRDIFEFLLK